MTPWTPLNRAQALAFLSPADEILFGGGCGGGKTALLAGVALTGPHTRSLIACPTAGMRRNAYDVVRHFANAGVMNLKEQVVPSRRNTLYVGNDQRICFMDGPQSPELWAQLQGLHFSFVGIESIGHLWHSEYLNLVLQCRSNEPEQKCQVIATATPPVGDEGWHRFQWILEAWAPWLSPDRTETAAEGELRWFITVPEVVRVAGVPPGQNPALIWRSIEVPNGRDYTYRNRVYTPRSRTFVSSTIFDNPNMHTMIPTLQSLPAAERERLLYGNFYNLVDQPDP